MTDIEAFLWISSIAVVFGIVHSLPVSPWVKTRLAKIIDQRLMRAWYRLLYTGLSVIATLLALASISMIPDEQVYSVWGIARPAFYAVQLTGLVIAVLAITEIDGPEFLGLRQAIAHLKGQPIGGDIEGVHERQLIKTGVFGLTRNPLYLAGILIISFSPDMSRTGLMVALLADIYFIYGAIVEARRLELRFGDEYREYARHSGLLLPRLSKIRNITSLRL